jgi:hypothetical protein
MKPLTARLRQLVGSAAILGPAVRLRSLTPQERIAQAKNRSEASRARALVTTP